MTIHGKYDINGQYRKMLMTIKPSNVNKWTKLSYKKYMDKSEIIFIIWNSGTKRHKKGMVWKRGNMTPC